MSIYIISTLAEVTPNNPNYDIRKTEYTVALIKKLHYGYPVFLIRSETNLVNESCVHHLFSKFESVYSVPNTFELTPFNTKSQKEFVSIQSFLHTNPNFADNDWIIKTSGRYILIDDTFVNTVKEASDETQGVARFACEGQAIYTFCFALRFKWFKHFFTKPNSELGNKCVERFLVECFREANIYNNILPVKTIGILSNPDNNGNFYFI